MNEQQIRKLLIDEYKSSGDEAPFNLTGKIDYNDKDQLRAVMSAVFMAGCDADEPLQDGHQAFELMDNIAYLAGCAKYEKCRAWVVDKFGEDAAHDMDVDLDE